MIFMTISMNICKNCLVPKIDVGKFVKLAIDQFFLGSGWFATKNCLSPSIRSAFSDFIFRSFLRRSSQVGKTSFSRAIREVPIPK